MVQVSHPALTAVTSMGPSVSVKLCATMKRVGSFEVGSCDPYQISVCSAKYAVVQQLVGCVGVFGTPNGPQSLLSAVDTHAHTHGNGVALETTPRQQHEEQSTCYHILPLVYRPKKKYQRDITVLCPMVTRETDATTLNSHDRRLEKVRSNTHDTHTWSTGFKFDALRRTPTEASATGLLAQAPRRAIILPVDAMSNQAASSGGFAILLARRWHAAPAAPETPLQLSCTNGAPSS